LSADQSDFPRPHSGQLLDDSDGLFRAQLFRSLAPGSRAAVSARKIAGECDLPYDVYRYTSSLVGRCTKPCWALSAGKHKRSGYGSLGAFAFASNFAISILSASRAAGTLPSSRSLRSAAAASFFIRAREPEAIAS